MPHRSYFKLLMWGVAIGATAFSAPPAEGRNLARFKQDMTCL